MKSNVITRLARVGRFAAMLALAVVPSAFAQTTTGSIRGYIRDATAAPVAGATVQARNLDIGTERTAPAGDNGFYNIPGLRPGRYALMVRRIGFGALADTVYVGVGQTIFRDYQMAPTAVELTSVVVIDAAAGTETRTSEVATNVTQQQINSLPTTDRNFLSLAALAPGTVLQGTREDDVRKTFAAGAQGAEQVNVFIDGATYKNDLIKGGIAGQDASRGNPFPRNAVQEFRVLTQNYKAEYQKASSAIITATTRTGGERWEGTMFFNALTDAWVALDTFQVASRAASPSTFEEPPYERYQMGISGGGPITERLRFFGSYEGQRQDRTSRVGIPAAPASPRLDTIDFAALSGDFSSPFRSSLFFGKLTWLHRDNSTFDFSYSDRHENDIRNFGGMTSFETATRFGNDVRTGVLKHTYATGDWLSEATGSFQYYRFNPTPNNPETVNLFFGFGCCVEIGGNRSFQDFRQRRASLREDLTYSGWRWLGEHVIKGGGNVDFLDYDVVKRNNENPRFTFEPWYNNFAFPHKAEYQTGDPNFGDRNTQFGAYLQDDWSPTSRLTLNLGVRWDYESNMINVDYVTPQAIVDTLIAYEDRLFLPLDRDRYFTDGTQRDRFLGAIQPRLGASYVVDSRGRTTVFGGWGIYYDRTLFDLTSEERFAQQHPQYTIFFSDPAGPPVAGQVQWEERFLTEGKAALDEVVATQQAAFAEIKLLPNDLRPPVSQQFSIGVRQLLGNFAVEAAYTGVRSKNVPTFYWANENFVCPERRWNVPGCFQHNNIPGFANVLFLDDNGRTWYDALALKVERPYQQVDEFGWGVGLAYTLAYRETAGFNDDFSFANPVDYPREPRNDERHRVVSNFIVDLPYLWGTQFSGLITLGSGSPYDVAGRFDPGFDPAAGELEKGSFILRDFWAYRMVDLRLRKDFPPIGTTRLSLTADLFNAFNYQNLGGYINDLNSADFGLAKNTTSDPRRFQLGVEYAF